MDATLPGASGRDQALLRLAWCIWAVLLAVIFVLVALHPHTSTTTGRYIEPAKLWWRGQDIYSSGINGFLYFPQSAILYGPFTLLPSPAGEVLYRLVDAGLLVSAVYRLARLAGGRAWMVVFFWITLMSLGPAAGGLRSGQMNVPLFALMAHAAADLADRRWGRAAAGLVLATALKPLAVVMVLLAAAVYPRPMAWRLGVGLLIAFLAPFVLQPHILQLNFDYPLRQYAACVHKLGVAGNAGEEFYPADLSGMLRTIHAEPPAAAMFAIRAVAAVLTLTLAWIARRRRSEASGAILLLALSATYLMLFNPRTENNSYIILSPIVGLAGAVALGQHRPWEGWSLLAMALGMGIATQVTLGQPNHWVRPLLAAVFLGYLGFVIVCRRPGLALDSGAAAEHAGESALAARS